MLLTAVVHCVCVKVYNFTRGKRRRLIGQFVPKSIAFLQQSELRRYDATKRRSDNATLCRFFGHSTGPKIDVERWSINGYTSLQKTDENVEKMDFRLTRISIDSVARWNSTWIPSCLRTGWPRAIRSDVCTPYRWVARNPCPSVCWTTPDRNRTLCPVFLSDCWSPLAWSSRPWPGPLGSWGPSGIRRWRLLCTNRMAGVSNPIISWWLKWLRKISIEYNIHQYTCTYRWNRVLCSIARWSLAIENDRNGKLRPKMKLICSDWRCYHIRPNIPENQSV